MNYEASRSQAVDRQSEAIGGTAPRQSQHTGPQGPCLDEEEVTQEERLGV